MGLRTAADILEEYTAARTAYLNALEASKLQHSNGITDREIQRQNIADLKKQMTDLSDEYDRLGRGRTMTVRFGVPSAK